MNEILEFKDEYFFLSNFYECPVLIGKYKFNSSEAAYQACKTTNNNDYKKFLSLSPDEAKKFGHSIIIRKDWDIIKDHVMKDIVATKFSQNTDLKQKLIDTYPNILVEGNTWGDTYWGVDITKPNKPGNNKLGEILMEVREALMQG